jgi:hypothetical protein
MHSLRPEFAADTAVLDTAVGRAGVELSLAMSMASASVSYGITVSTGPKISSRAIDPCF